MEKITPTLLSWASILEQKTRDQAVTTATMPFIHPHVALMPDAHLGLGRHRRSVIPTLGGHHPGLRSGGGLTIGCGMIAVRTQFTTDQLPAERRTLREAIERAVPLYGGRRETARCARAHPRAARGADPPCRGGGFEPGSYATVDLQLGTLGSGNHFIEVTADEEHASGSSCTRVARRGQPIAQRHNQVARTLCERWWIPLPDRDLAYLVEGTDEFWAYIRQMRWAQRYALLNREEMMDRVVRQFAEWVGLGSADMWSAARRSTATTTTPSVETHFGREVWLSRKGAINAVRPDGPA